MGTVFKIFDNDFKEKGFITCASHDKLHYQVQEALKYIGIPEVILGIIDENEFRKGNQKVLGYILCNYSKTTKHVTCTFLSSDKTSCTYKDLTSIRLPYPVNEGAEMDRKNYAMITETEIKLTKLISLFLLNMGDAHQTANESCRDYTETEHFAIAQEFLKDIITVAKQGYLSYSSALFLLKQGFKVSRAKWGWKGTNVYIQTQFPDEHSKMTEPYTYMVKRLFDDDKNKIGESVFPSVISDESVYANDWFLVEE